MLDFPSTLTIKVSDQASGQPIYRVALIITLFAATKNDYHIPRVTSPDGEVELTIDELRQTIARDQQFFIMDYSSTLEECSRELEFEICDSEQIRRTTDAMEMYKEVADIDEELIAGFKNSVNAHYAVPVVKRATINPNLDKVEIKIKLLN